MKNGVSTQWSNPLVIQLHRGGGSTGGDYLASGPNCSTFYTNKMGSNLMAGVDPYYLKCYDATASSPLNTVRLQHISQLQTMDYAPELPQMLPVTNVSACLRMIQNFR